MSSVVLRLFVTGPSVIFIVVCCGVCFVDRFFFFSSRRRHTRCLSDWSSDVCSSDLPPNGDPSEAMSTLWYHDHRVEFTSPNVYKGLAGMYLLFDELDTGNELTGLHQIGRASCRERV